MENVEYTHPSIAQLKAYEDRAHQLRAQAMRHGLRAISGMVKTGLRNVRAFISTQRKAWNPVGLTATPPLGS